MSKYKEEDIEKAKELIRENEYNICLDDHTDIKYMIEQTHIVGASDEELIKRAQEITKDCEDVKPFNPKSNKLYSVYKTGQIESQCLVHADSKKEALEKAKEMDDFQLIQSKNYRYGELEISYEINEEDE